MHPLTPNLTELSESDLQKKYTDLNTRLSQAYRMGNGPLVEQVRMMLDDYTAEIGRRQQKMMDELMERSGDKFNGIIDIQ